MNHHFVPQSLLRNWYNIPEKGNAGFKRFKKNDNGMINFSPHNISSKSCCSEKNLYATYDNIDTKHHKTNEKYIEKRLEKIDDQGMKSIQSILNTNFNEISETTFELLFQFILSLHLRTPQKIKYVEKEIDCISDKKIMYIKNKEKYFFEKYIKNITRTGMLDALENYKGEQTKKYNFIKITSAQDYFYSGELPLISSFETNGSTLDDGFAISLNPKTVLIGIRKSSFELSEIHKLTEAIILNYNRIVCEQSGYIIFNKAINGISDQEFISKYLGINRM